MATRQETRQAFRRERRAEIEAHLRAGGRVRQGFGYPNLEAVFYGSRYAESELPSLAARIEAQEHVMGLPATLEGG